MFELWIGHRPKFLKKGDEARFDEVRRLVWNKPDFSERFSFVKVIEVD